VFAELVYRIQRHYPGGYKPPSQAGEAQSTVRQRREHLVQKEVLSARALVGRLWGSGLD
jgi:hypothetical protein